MRFPLGGPYLLAGGGALLIASTMLLGPPSSDTTPESPSASPSVSATLPPVSRDGCADRVVIHAVRDKDKNSRYAFANPADVAQDEMFNTLTDLVYEDPIIASGLLAAVDRDYTSLNDRPVNLVDDHTVWCEEVGMALDKLQTATFTLEDVDSGSWTLFAVPESNQDDDIPVGIYQAKTTATEQAAVYRFATYTVKFLPDYGFSPVRSVKFEEVPTVPKTVTPTPSPSASSAQPSASAGSTGSSAAPGTVNHDPHHNGNADQGGGTTTGLGSTQASDPSGTPPATRRTNPPAPSSSPTSSQSSSVSSATSPTTAPSRTVPQPELSAPPASDPETGCVVVPGVEDCT